MLTGASRGIGRATALLLAKRGQSLALLGRPSRELDETAEAAVAAGAPESPVFDADIAPMDEVDAAARAIAPLFSMSCWWTPRLARSCRRTLLLRA